MTCKGRDGAERQETQESAFTHARNRVTEGEERESDLRETRQQVDRLPSRCSQIEAEGGRETEKGSKKVREIRARNRMSTKGRLPRRRRRRRQALTEGGWIVGERLRQVHEAIFSRPPYG